MGEAEIGLPGLESPVEHVLGPGRLWLSQEGNTLQFQPLWPCTELSVG